MTDAHDASRSPNPQPVTIRGYVTRNGNQVVLLPDTFAGHPGLLSESAVPSSAARLSSPTVETIDYWREQLTSSDALMEHVCGVVNDVAQNPRFDPIAPSLLAQAKITVANLDTIRTQLDHLLAMLPANQDQWTTWHTQLAENARVLYDQYTALAAAVYGNGYPLDGPSGVPVLPAEMRGVPALAGFPPLDGVTAHEGDGMSVALIGQSSSIYAQALDILSGRATRSGGAADIPAYCCEHGVFPAFGDGDVSYCTEPPLPGLTIIPPLALSTTGIIYAASTADHSRGLAQKTQTLVRWADRAGQCIAAGGEPADCSEGKSPTH